MPEKNTDMHEIKIALKKLIQTQKETEKRFKETDAKFKETDARFKETDVKFKETDIKFKETDARIKRAFDLFESQWGKLIESLVEGDLIRLLNERNIQVHDTALRRSGTHNGEQFEYDIIARNGGEIVIVEVKTTLRVSHVKHFITKLKKASLYLDEYASYTIYGAVAYLKADEASHKLAENEGLIVIRATGKSAMIMNPLDFKPRKF